MKAVLISDTHGSHTHFDFEDDFYSETDMIIHSGDFSWNESSFNDFILWYSEQPFKYKILVAGNHDKYAATHPEETKRICKELDIIYLKDSAVTINDIVFYGSPYTVRFGNYWFMEDDLELEKVWDKIPEHTNVLITHGPAHGVLDFVSLNKPHTGSITLKERIEHLRKLKFHICGHIHESRGIEYLKNYIAINSVIFNQHSMKIPKPYIIDLS